MKVDPAIQRILDRALDRLAPSKEDCVRLLDVRSDSLEASMLRAVADRLTRERFGDEAIVLGQIGIEISACPGKCKFCSFGEGHTHFSPSEMTMGEIVDSAVRFTASGDLFALFLMTMHHFGFGRLMEAVGALRQHLPPKQQLVVNIGDFDAGQAKALYQAGVNGAYHVLRLREGEDTAIAPDSRLSTIRAIKDAGLDWYYCCEPVGPEHGAKELVDQIFLGVEQGCFQHAAMRRVYLPGSALESYGQITELRLGQVTAVVALATLGCGTTRNIAVHEPNLIGLTSGANVVYAETGANPRDTVADTSGNRGRDVLDCKRMLQEAGFTRLLFAPAEHRPLAGSKLGA